MPTQPNIIYLHSHDTGRYIQPYGYSVPTPHLQRFAEEGMLFRQAFCAAPTCSPSRACLLTGQAAHNNGMLGLSHMGFGLADYRQHLVSTLQAAGYFCALSGIQHEDGPAGELETYAARIGYDAVLDREGMTSIWDHRQAEVCAAKFLRNAPQQPFFLACGFNETHRAFPEPFSAEDEKYCRPPAYFPDTPEMRRDMAGFIHSARLLDRKMGMVLTALAESGLADNTLVIITTDHGIAFPRMKCNLTDGGTGVMLMLRGPGGFAGGQVVEAMVSHLDIFPTLCELLGIAPPAWLQGRSLLPLVRGEVEELHEALFSEVNFHAAYEPQRGVRTNRWKYIRRFHDYPTPILVNCDEGLTRTAYLREAWATRPLPREELYDLFYDPQEAHNRVDDPACAAVLAEMRAQLARWMTETDDPLLAGPLLQPSGTAVFTQDAVDLRKRPTPIS